MLVVALRAGAGETADVPRDLRSLYKSATRKVIATRARSQDVQEDGIEEKLHRMLFKVARFNQMRGMLAAGGEEVRTFNDSEVREALSDDMELVALWKKLEETDAGVPLVKTLQLPDEGEGLYQVRDRDVHRTLT
jgi:hypothetical protein